MISVENFTHEKIKSLIVKIWNKDACSKKQVKIETDTRNFSSQSAFIAIKGEKHDPFVYTEAILSQVPIVVFEDNEKNRLLANDWAKKFPSTVFISVKNSISYLQQLAHLHVREWYMVSATNYLIAISGSNGKTTTKEMMAHVLTEVFGSTEVIATKKNNNNHIGVPLTIFDIDPQKTKIAVVEFGSNHPGEMKVLCDLACPNVGIVTNIGLTHMEFFNELEDVFIEEGLIYHAVMSETKKNGFFLINDDDDFISKFANQKSTKRFSIKNPDVDFFYNIEHQNAELIIKNTEFNGQYKIVNSKVTGAHNFINLSNSVALSAMVYPNLIQKFVAAAASFTPTPNRSQWISYKQKDVFLDAYNANPSSMKAALTSFIEFTLSQGFKKSELLVVVGEMKELGVKSLDYHQEFARWLKTLELTNIIYIGDFRSQIEAACPGIQVYENVQSAEAFFLEKLLQSKKIFIKASRSLQLERLVGITKG